MPVLQAIRRSVYLLKSLGIGKVVGYILIYPFRKARLFEEWAGRVRREKRSHLVIYDVWLRSKSDGEGLSSKRKKEIEEYFKKFGVPINTKWHETFFSANGIDSNFYLSEYLFYEFVEPAFKYSEAEGVSFTDKNLYSRNFRDIRQPETFLRYMDGKFYDAAYNRLDQGAGFNMLKENAGISVIKPSQKSGGGRDVNLLSVREGALFLNETQISSDELLKLYKNGFIVQERVKQHPVLSEIYQHSLNTIKLVTFRFQDEIRLISTLFRTGNKGHYLDNMKQGGFCCKVNSDGTLQNVAYDKALQQYRNHPNTGIPFGKVTVPRFREIVDAARRMHESMQYSDIASWDLAVGTDATPILIEVNLKYQGILYQQVACGPLFGDLTDDVLNFVFS